MTCTASGRDRLAALARDADKVRLVYHGLDFARFAAPDTPRPDLARNNDGADPARPVRLLSVGRLVEKKGTGDLLAALARLPAEPSPYPPCNHP